MTDSFLPYQQCSSPQSASPEAEAALLRSLSSKVRIYTDRANSLRLREANQQIVEEELVALNTCENTNSQISENLRLRLFGINDRQLNDLIASPYSMNANFQQELACLLSAISSDYDSPATPETSSELRARIRHWISNITQIGQPSVEGYALRGAFHDKSDIFVLKAPRNPKDDNLIHEACIGMCALNKLRRILPNYMYVYGHFRCSPPIIDDKHALTFCASGQNAVSYLITENIRDAQTIADFMSDPRTDAETACTVFMQVVNALNLAKETYGYMHGDLHGGNVMVREYDQELAIPLYAVAQKDQPQSRSQGQRPQAGYIVSRYVAYLIDYGYNRIQLGDVPLGKQGMEKVLDIHKAVPMFDIYKLICFMGQAVLTRKDGFVNQAVYDILDNLYGFFDNKQSLKKRVLARLSAKGDFYEVSDEFSDVTYDQFIGWLDLNSDVFLFHHMRDREELTARNVLLAPLDEAVSDCLFSKITNLDQAPQTASDYCDAMRVLSDLKGVQLVGVTAGLQEEAISWLNERFSAINYINETLPDVEQKVAETTREWRNLPKLTRLDTPRYITHADFTENYRKYLLALINLRQFQQELTEYVASSQCALGFQRGLSSEEEREDLEPAFEQMTWANHNFARIVEDNVIIAQENVKILKDIKVDYDRLSPETRMFWAMELPSLLLALS